jgi:hypothetical protein
LGNSRRKKILMFQCGSDVQSTYFEFSHFVNRMEQGQFVKVSFSVT